jgi:hypothetical protein
VNSTFVGEAPRDSPRIFGVVFAVAAITLRRDLPFPCRAQRSAVRGRCKASASSTERVSLLGLVAADVPDCETGGISKFNAMPLAGGRGGYGTRLGPSIWRRIATSTLRTADDAYLSAICNGGWRPVKARLKCSRVPDSPISTGFQRTNGKVDRATEGSLRAAGKLTETREITPYLWVHPDEER